MDKKKWVTLGIIAVVVLVLVVVAYFVINGNESDDGSDISTEVIMYPEKTEEIKLKMGESFGFEYEVLPSQGYLWRYTISKEGYLEGSKDGVAFPEGEEITSDSVGIQEYIFKTIKKGTVEITFEHYNFIQGIVENSFTTEVIIK
jgi:Predicted secreted protein